MFYKTNYNAKLLLTAEYLVLNGAQALALPLRFGQSLQVEENDLGLICWNSIDHNGLAWFKGKYSVDDFSIIEAGDPEMAKYPQSLLIAARRLNPDFCKGIQGYDLIFTLNYPLLWGLGSSSTLIAAVAAWADVNPFALHFGVSNGSGYDIACALSDGPIVYSIKNRIPSFERVALKPRFAEKIFFVYLGNKQDSAQGIKTYKNLNSKPAKELIDYASSLTTRMLNAKSIQEFEIVISEHEKMVSNLIGISSIMNKTFYDLPGEVKSLGAWGGDFCMLTWNENTDLLPAYLKSKGLSVCFNFSDIVL